GHNSYNEDIALAKAVPGIHLILGTHSHIKENLALIPGTQTWMASPYQFLSYVSHLELRFRDGGISGITGDLVRMDSTLPEAADIKKRVDANEQLLRADPLFSARFKKIGSIDYNISNSSHYSIESELGNWTMDILRAKAKAHIAVSTASSFRSEIQKGDLTTENVLESLPFQNQTVVLEMKGHEIRFLFEMSLKKRGTDSFLQFSGVKVVAKNTSIKQIQILKEPTEPELGYTPILDGETYSVAMTNYLADVAIDYRSVLGAIKDRDNKNFTVNQAVIDALSSTAPARPRLDGRIRFEE
ncbi:MAG: bifunctional metallophosphatase/5'-nucleotidase, partial [Bdellovibrionota bacterium]